jgi:hypothetical protein
MMKSLLFVNSIRTMPTDSSEAFRSVPSGSEEFGSLPKTSESFRVVRNASERREDHTLTVREVARLFEAAGVSRTERSITNWCQPNKTGIARLDAYLDPNERKYFITPASAEAAIQEELAREKASDAASERPEVPSGKRESVSGGEAETLHQEIVDLKIANRVKDKFIEVLQSENEKFGHERQRYIDELMRSSRQIGELETKLRQIESPNSSHIG